MTLENLTGRKLEYINHFDRCENIPLFRNVISGDTSFQKQVEDFYDLTTWVVVAPRAGMVRYYDIRTEKPEKIGIAPVDLVRVLQTFSEKNLHANELTYESVRGSYGNKGMNLRGLLGVAGILASGVSLSKSIHFFQDSDLQFALISLFLGIGGGIGAYKTLVNDPRRLSSEPVNALEGYISLHDAALCADEFIQEVYRSYFIKKVLSTK